MGVSHRSPRPVRLRRILPSAFLRAAAPAPASGAEDRRLGAFDGFLRIHRHEACVLAHQLVIERQRRNHFFHCRRALRRSSAASGLRSSYGPKPWPARRARLRSLGSFTCKRPTHGFAFYRAAHVDRPRRRHLGSGRRQSPAGQPIAPESWRDRFPRHRSPPQSIFTFANCARWMRVITS